MGLKEIFEKIANNNLNFTVLDAIDILLEGPRERLGEGFEERYPAGEVIAAPLK